MAALEMNGEDELINNNVRETSCDNSNNDLVESSVMSAMKPDIDTAVVNGDQASSDKVLQDHPEACVANGACDNEPVAGDLPDKTSSTDNNDTKNPSGMTNELNSKSDIHPKVDDVDNKCSEILANGASDATEDLKEKIVKEDTDKSQTKLLVEAEKKSRSRSSTPTRTGRLKEENTGSRSGTPVSRESTPVSTISSRGATPVGSSRDSTPIPQNSATGNTPGPTTGSDKMSQVVNSNKGRKNSGEEGLGSAPQSENQVIGHVPSSNKSEVASVGNRSSEERSVDSDSSSSKQNVTKMPKARKSAAPAKSSSVIRVPGSNVTVKLPDFENPIKLDTKTLEKISMLGKSHDHKVLSNSNTSGNKAGSKVRKIGACSSSKVKTGAKDLKSGAGDINVVQKGGEDKTVKDGKAKPRGTKMDLESDETIKKLSKVEAKLGGIGMRSARKIKRLGRGRLKSMGTERDSPKKLKKTKRKIFSKKFGEAVKEVELNDSSSVKNETSENGTMPSVKEIDNAGSTNKVSNRVRKRRRKMGTYKLPNEIKKKAAAKKKDEEKYDSDDSEGSQLSEGRKRERTNALENFDDLETDAIDSSLVSESDLSNVTADTGVSESDASISESLNDSVSNSSQNKSGKKPIWDIFNRTKLTPKSKISPGGTRSKFNSLKKSPSSLHSERKVKTIAEYMMQKQSRTDLIVKQEKLESPEMMSGIEQISSSTDDVDGLTTGDKRGLRKRKKDDEDGELDTNSDTAVLDSLAGKKKKVEELDGLIPQSSMPSSAFRSLLPRNLVSSAVNSVSSATPVITMSAVNTSTLIPTSKPIIFTVAQPTNTINNVASIKPQQFLLLTDSRGSGTLLQPLPVFPPTTNNVRPPGGCFKQQIPIPVVPPQITMVTKTTSSGGVCLWNNQLALSNSLLNVKTSKSLNTDNKVELIDSSRPVLSSLLSAPPEFTSTYQDRDNSVTSDNSSYPVTPPRTPDDQQSEDSLASAPSGPTPPDKDIIPLCCCKINGASFKKLGSSVTYCQALDSIDGKVMGCCNKVTNYQLVRPGVKIPFMAVCEAHRKRLRLHHCCPGCGHFCTQGKFNQCKKEGGVSIHHFHPQCQVVRDSKHYCPHCGEISGQVEITLTLEQPRNNTVFDEKFNKGSLNRARMGGIKLSFKDKESTDDLATVSHKLLNDRYISTGGIPMGPDRNSLEKVLTGLTEERPRKYKSKCMYNPAYEGDLERVVFMLADGFNPNEAIEDFDNQTALHAAAICGSLSVVHVLVQAGANIHAVDKELKTPLMYAAENNHLEVTNYLIAAGSQISLRAEDGMTVLHYASKAGHVDIIRCLLSTDDIKIDVQDDGGWTPIIWASEHKFVDAVKFLIKQGADANLKDKEENTALHWAAFSGSVGIAELFLNAGCDVESPNEHGDRPLHIAARQDHYECVVLFLARGADVEAKNNENETAIGCCPDENSQVCLALKVNRQLKGLATKAFCKVEKLVHRDVSMGRENIPIAVINSEDDEPRPNDFQYITENCETSSLNINRTITSLQSCRCSDDCSSMFCVCGRNSIKCWFNKEMRLLPEFNMLEPPLIFECNKGCRCWSTCNNRVVQMGITCRLQIFRTNGRGWGVKTLLDIPMGSFVCEYIGELITDSEADSREDDSYLFDLDNRDGDTYCIDARKYGNISRFINHLCEPNLIPVKVFVDHQDLRFPRICFFSSREIKAHEELGFDYGEKFWVIKWKQFTCACGSSKCKYSTDTIQKTLEDYRLRHEDEEVTTQES